MTITRTFFEADTGAGSGAAQADGGEGQDSGTEQTQAQPDASAELVARLEALEAKNAEIVADRNSWKSKFRALESSHEAKKREAAEKSGDYTAVIESLKSSLAQTEESVAAERRRRHQIMAEAALLQEAADKAYSPKQFLAFARDGVAVVEVDGQEIVGVKDGDGIRYEGGKPVPVASFVEMVLKENPNLSKSGFAGGTNTQQSGVKITDGETPSSEQWAGMTGDQQSRWLQSNPQKARELMKKLGLE